MALFRSSKSRRVKVSVFGKTDVGKARDHNEDAFLVADLSTKNASLQPEVREHELGPKGTLLVIADGMGGAAAGEVASNLATKTIYEHMSTKWVDEEDNSADKFAYRLREAVEEANTAIYLYAKERPEVRGMGTTTTAVGLLEDHLYLSQVGDSRAYLVRDGKGAQITKDQSLMQRLIDAGEISEEEAEHSERRNIILQALGPEATVKVDLTHQTARRGDTVIICSDGLSGLVDKDEIAATATSNEDLAVACTDLIALANERGGPDNITVVIARLDGDGLDAAKKEDTVGHTVYPLLDTESTTEPVPVYDGSDPPSRKGQAALLLTAAVSAVIIAVAVLAAAVGM